MRIVSIILGLAAAFSLVFYAPTVHAYPPANLLGSAPDLSQTDAALPIFQQYYVQPEANLFTNNPIFVPGSFAVSSAPLEGPNPAIRATAFLVQPSHRTVAPDRWEGFNRFTFRINDRTDKLIFVPLSRGYRKVTTRKMRKALSNFLENLNTPVVLINDILQGRLDRAAETTGRFIINTTIGFGGVADPAARLGIPNHTEDFGQTLAVWGVPSGPYLVLPLFGPSTVRDGIGLGIDSVLLSPLNYFRTGAAQKARFSRAGASLLAQREPLIEPLEEIERTSLDFYSSFRSFYLQARRREILNGETILEDLPELDEFDDFDDFDL